MTREAYCATCGPTEADERGCRRCSYQYDDNGDPLVTTSERILRALRFHDWIDPLDLYDQLELAPNSPERNAHQSAMTRFVKAGAVERKTASYYNDTNGRQQSVTLVRIARKS